MGVNSEQIISLDSFGPFGERKILEFSHVSDAVSDSGVKINGNCVRLTAHFLGGLVSFIYDDALWEKLCDDMKAITKKPTAPDTFGASTFAEIRKEAK